MDGSEFEEMVREALRSLPREIRDRMENVGVVVEDEPENASSPAARRGSKGTVLGLYQGVPQKHRTHEYGMVMPDKITVYRKNIERSCAETGCDLSEEVRRVVWHEVAHHFGISDRRLRKIDAY